MGYPYLVQPLRENPEFPCPRGEEFEVKLAEYQRNLRFLIFALYDRYESKGPS